MSYTYTTREQSSEYYDWVIGFLEGDTKAWGRFYSDNLTHTAGPRRRAMLERAMAHGFGDTGPITHLQDR